MGRVVATHLRNIVDRVQYLKSASSSFASFVGHTSAVYPISFGSNPLSPPFALIDTKLAYFSAELSLVRSIILDLMPRTFQDAVESGGVNFYSLAQTTTWMTNDLPSSAYSVFQDGITLLNLNGTSNLSDGDFLDGKYKASRSNFVNVSAARCAHLPLDDNYRLYLAE